MIKSSPNLMNFEDDQETIDAKLNFIEAVNPEMLELLEDEKPASKHSTLIFLWLYTIIEAASTTMVNPLIPAEAQRHGIDQFLVGIMFFMMSGSCLTSSMVLGQLQSMLGRRNIILASFMLKMAAYVGFIYLRYTESPTLSLVVLLCLHVWLGVSMGAYKTSVYSILTLVFPDNIDFVVSCIESSSGLGFSFGPALGSLLFAIGGFELPFYLFLAVITVMTTLTTVFIPAYINYNQTVSVTEVNVSYFTAFKNKRIAFACLVVAMNAMTYDFLNPLLAEVMYSYYAITQSQVGFLFFIMGMGYVISCNLVNLTLRYVTNRRVTVTFLIVNGIWMLFLGPSNLLHTGENLYITLVALVAWGLSSAHFFVPAYSEIVEPGKHELGIEKDTMNDLASGLSNTVYFLGQMIGYTSSSYIYTNYGFPATTDTLAMLLIGSGILYFVMWDRSMFGSQEFNEDNQDLKNVDNEDIKVSLIETIT